jgi:hypothetical protein
LTTNAAAVSLRAPEIGVRIAALLGRLGELGTQCGETRPA